MFSVHDSTAKQIAIDRGFKELKCSHLTHSSQVPLFTNPTQCEMSEQETTVTNNTLVLPQMMQLKLIKKKKESTAQSLVRVFEESYIFQDKDKQECIFSPCLEWNEKARKENGLVGANSPFLKWCTAYYAVKYVMSDQEPSGIDNNLTDLIKIARKEGKKPRGTNWYDFLISKCK